jgi:hypothetical protein
MGGFDKGMEVETMKMVSSEQATVLERRGERGAALITTLLVATLLLAAGGALIFTSAMAGINSTDSTTEMQAYYGAEAGLQAAINVLRGNKDSNPAGSKKATFRNIADNPTLSTWVTYNDTAADGTSVVRVSDNTDPFIAYSLKIINIDNVASPDEPQRLLVEVRGYGPRGAITNKQMIVNKFAYDPDLPAAITLVGAEVGASMTVADFDIGDSSPKGYTGTDSATGSTTIKATFGFTVDADKTMADLYFAGSTKATDTTEDTPRTKKLNNSDLPTWLRTADKTRTFLNEIETIASDQGRVFTSAPPSFGTTTNPVITFVKGDCDLSGNGAGMLIVTGNLTFKGDFEYDGMVLVLGTGNLTRNGGGGGGIYGGLVMANFDRAATGGKFLAKPIFNTNGGGNSDIKYNSKWLQAAMATLGPSVKGVREF